MVDRDPIGSWTYGPVMLMGDAAHPTYPFGSKGASHTIVDAHMIGAKLLSHGVKPEAVKAYEDDVLPNTSNVTIANRSSGPDAIKQMVEDRSADLTTASKM